MSEQDYDEQLHTPTANLGTIAPIDQILEIHGHYTLDGQSYAEGGGPVSPEDAHAPAVAQDFDQSQVQPPVTPDDIYGGYQHTDSAPPGTGATKENQAADGSAKEDKPSAAAAPNDIESSIGNITLTGAHAEKFIMAGPSEIRERFLAEAEGLGKIKGSTLAMTSKAAQELYIKVAKDYGRTTGTEVEAFVALDLRTERRPWHASRDRVVTMVAGTPDQRHDQMVNIGKFMGDLAARGQLPEDTAKNPRNWALGAEGDFQQTGGTAVVESSAKLSDLIADLRPSVRVAQAAAEATKREKNSDTTPPPVAAKKELSAALMTARLNATFGVPGQKQDSPGDPARSAERDKQPDAGAATGRAADATSAAANADAGKSPGQSPSQEPGKTTDRDNKPGLDKKLEPVLTENAAAFKEFGNRVNAGKVVAASRLEDKNQRGESNAEVLLKQSTTAMKSPELGKLPAETRAQLLAHVSVLISKVESSPSSATGLSVAPAQTASTNKEGISRVTDADAVSRTDLVVISAKQELAKAVVSARAADPAFDAKVAEHLATMRTVDNGQPVPAASAQDAARLAPNAFTAKLDEVARAGPDALTTPTLASSLNAIQEAVGRRLIDADPRMGSGPTQTITRVQGILAEARAVHQPQELQDKAKDIQAAMQGWVAENTARVQLEGTPKDKVAKVLAGHVTTIQKDDPAWHQEAIAAMAQVPAAQSSGTAASQAPEAVPIFTEGQSAARVIEVMHNPQKALLTEDKTYNMAGIKELADHVGNLGKTSDWQEGLPEECTIRAYSQLLVSSAESGNLPGFKTEEGKQLIRDMTKTVNSIRDDPMPQGGQDLVAKTSQMLEHKLISDRHSGRTQNTALPSEPFAGASPAASPAASAETLQPPRHEAAGYDNAASPHSAADRVSPSTGATPTTERAAELGTTKNSDQTADLTRTTTPSMAHGKELER